MPLGNGTITRMAIHPPGPDTPAHPTGRHWRWLLLLPYLGLCFPAFYARATPTLWGFPFFYWYQFAWVIVASALIGFVYSTHRD